MKQRVPRRAWYSPAMAGHRPRVLVEDDRPALAISDFSSFQDAGFDVAICSGPGRDAQDCPLLRGQECVVLARADAVLHGLDPALGIAEAIRQRHPDIAVLVERSRGADEGPQAAPAGSIPLPSPCSVPGQVEALRRALARQQDARRAVPGRDMAGHGFR